MLPARDDSASPLLAEPALREALVRYVARRVAPRDVDDIVQQVLVEVLASSPPSEHESFKNFLFAVARNKVVDWYRSRRLESEPRDLPDASAEPVHDAKHLIDWALNEVPKNDEATRTLEWMLREADGDKLESIAREERIPATRVRQRVSRLRRYFRSRWALQVAALAALVLGIAAVLALIKRNQERPLPIAGELVPETSASLSKSAQLRQQAAIACAAGDYERCTEALDAAKQLDPDGEQSEEVQALRRVAGDDAPMPPAKSPIYKNEKDGPEKRGSPAPLKKRAPRNK